MSIFIFTTGCKNERRDYPSDIMGEWQAVESETSWMNFDSTNVAYNIKYQDNVIKDSAWYIYVKASGYAIVPIEDERSKLAVIEIQMSDTKEEMVAVGEDKDVRELFTYHLVKK